MTDSGLEARRRNLFILSVVIVIFTLGGGRFDTIFWIKLTNEWVAVAVFYVMFSIAWWRFYAGTRKRLNEYLKRWMGSLLNRKEFRELLLSWFRTQFEKKGTFLGTMPTGGQITKYGEPPSGHYVKEGGGHWAMAEELSDADFRPSIKALHGWESGTVAMILSVGSFGRFSNEGTYDVINEWTVSVPPASATKEQRKLYNRMRISEQRKIAWFEDEFFENEFPHLLAALAVGTSIGAIIDTPLLDTIWGSF